MSAPVVRVYLVQCKSTGHFLDWEQNLVRSFREAAITDDQQNAMDTAVMALGQDFEIHSVFVTHEKLERFHTVGFA